MLKHLDATKFLSYVTGSMLSARRSQPIPLDFEYALRYEGLTSRLLKPHLKTAIPASKLKPEFLPVPIEEHIYRPATGLLGEELSGESEKRTKSYIPRQFPAFPSKHTYKSTEVKSERETDPRKIREKATEEARHGEEALRRLVKVGKDHRSTSRAGDIATRLRTRHQMWEEAMEELSISNPQARSLSGKEGDDEQSILVNAAKQYGRRPVTRNRGLQA
jgi:transcription initiation factor TFIID subunit 8